MKHTNQLIYESSPYLLQHAHNPVNWLPFGNLALNEAKVKNKPLFISIGYSSCHWCHVMEHESFENEEIAEMMNEFFICVKVDREERPDVDHVFMDAVHQIHGNGGWPLNCFALPDGRPFWGGTYFTPTQFKQLLENIIELFKSRYDDLEHQATQITEGVVSGNFLASNENGVESSKPDFAAIFSLVNNSFDSEKGGMKGAPKFPMPVVLQFILQFAIAKNDDLAFQTVNTTLLCMAKGGIFDQIGGGFARYSTDSEWKVPHFEKMLYDNAQLISLYSSAYQLTGKRIFKEVVEQTITFVKRELTSQEGVFYSALDADSEGEEGLYYTWSADEFNKALGHYAVLAGEYYGIGKQGLWEYGRNILIRPPSDELFSQQHFLSAEELQSLTSYCRNQLLKVRCNRQMPGLDDKMLVAWNAQMISGLADASIALGNNDYLLASINAADFILKNLKRSGNGLFHTWKNGKSQINAFLDDYAFTCDAFLKLYSLTIDVTWLNETEKLLSYLDEHFYDPDSGFFWYSENEDQQVFARKIEIYDGVIPSSNSVIAGVLIKLGTFLHNDDHIEKAHRMLKAIENKYTTHPAAYAQWASLAMCLSKKQCVVAVVGSDAVSCIQKLSAEKLTGVMIFGTKTESELPYFENRFIEGKTLFYICSGSSCFKPVELLDEAMLLINKMQD